MSNGPPPTDAIRSAGELVMPMSICPCNVSENLTTKLRHAGPATQDDKTRANRRCLERMVRFPVSETRSADASERQRVMPRSGEAIRQPRAPDPAVVMQLPAAWEADEAKRPAMIRCPRDQWPAAD